MQQKLTGFKQTDIVTVDTASLNQLSITADLERKGHERRLKAEKDRKRMQAYFERLPKVQSIEVEEEEVFPDEAEI